MVTVETEIESVTVDVDFFGVYEELRVSRNDRPWRAVVVEDDGAVCLEMKERSVRITEYVGHFPMAYVEMTDVRWFRKSGRLFILAKPEQTHIELPPRMAEAWVANRKKKLEHVGDDREI